MRDGIISEQMKSRLIKAGLPATYEELVALAADTGIPADILFNEEGWQQLPTYLSKANLLSDATEIAIWENAKNRTVNDALKMLADVAYGRVASLTLTINDTAGNPIPDVTVRLDSAPSVGQDPTTGADGKIKLDTSGGSHTLYLVYPLGYSAENAQQSIQVTGNTTITVASVTRSTSAYFKLTSAKTFYIARYLSPVQFDIRGGGGSGCVVSSIDESVKGYYYAQGGAGGYVNLTGAIDVQGKLIRVVIGSGGASKTSNGSGNRGGTTTVMIDSDKFTAKGGAGGTNTKDVKNTDGGAAGGAGSWTYSNRSNGEDGRYLFDDTSLARKGAGGGGAYLGYKQASGGGDQKRVGTGGSVGGTSAYCAGSYSSTDVFTDDATDASGSGANIRPKRSGGGNVGSGKGGPGFVAFRKAV